ncbi:hypothetical protein OH77DRAFT_154706 [Trametes cingulata]|nr:hypothetical protein OH77DRAFT_154706 [Trametes cingulata]
MCGDCGRAKGPCRDAREDQRCRQGCRRAQPVLKRSRKKRREQRRPQWREQWRMRWNWRWRQRWETPSASNRRMRTRRSAQTGRNGETLFRLNSTLSLQTAPGASFLAPLLEMLWTPSGFFASRRTLPEKSTSTKRALLLGASLRSRGRLPRHFRSCR